MELISEIAGEVIGGKSVTSVAERYDLDPASLLRRLRSPSLKGVVMLHDEIVRDHEGMPVLREPILSAKTWGRLQARLDAGILGGQVSRVTRRPGSTSSSAVSAEGSSISSHTASA